MIGDELEDRRCSRAACRETATWAIMWRNPRIHGVDRRKVWTACDEHVEFLTNYLRSRDFPVEVAPFEEAAL